MNEEQDQFSIDVEAEKQTFSYLVEEDVKPSDLLNILQDIPLPERTPFDVKNIASNNIDNVTLQSPQDVQALPDLITLQATEIQVENFVKPQNATTSGLDFEIKMEAEEAYKKSLAIEGKMKEMQGGFSDLYSEIKGGKWLQNTNRDDFEERPLTEPRNLLFEFRRDKSSEFPPYA